MRIPTRATHPSEAWRGTAVDTAHRVHTPDSCPVPDSQAAHMSKEMARFQLEGGVLGSAMPTLSPCSHSAGLSWCYWHCLFSWAHHLALVSLRTPGNLVEPTLASLAREAKLEGRQGDPGNTVLEPGSLMAT